MELIKVTKTCKKCGEAKELDLFAKGAKYADGRRNTCKKCHSNYMTQYYKDNPEKIKNIINRAVLLNKGNE